MKLSVLFVLPLLILGSSMLTRSDTDGPSPKMQHTLTGTWGGRHIRISVERGSASVDYDCANGSIPAPLTVKRDGSFSWRGFYSPEHGGPVRDDEQPNRRLAVYSGSISGNVMNLKVRLAGDHKEIGSFSLNKDSDGEVFKCR